MDFAVLKAKVTQGDIATIPEEFQAKFAPDGRPRLYHGVTALCHLREEESQRALLQAMADHLPKVGPGRAGPSHIELPEASLHMTVFDIKVHRDSETLGGLSPREARDRDLAIFSRGFAAMKPKLQRYAPIKMKIDLDVGRYPRSGGVLVVPLEPYDGDEARKLRSIRDMLGGEFGVRPNHDTYKFHITTHYPLCVLDEKDFDTIKERWTEAITRLSESTQMFHIDRIELCQFDDMCQFDIVDSFTLTG